MYSIMSRGVASQAAQSLVLSCGYCFLQGLLPRLEWLHMCNEQLCSEGLFCPDHMLAVKCTS